MINARIYRPTINGQKRWGFWFYEDGKKRQRLRNPETGDPFRTRSDVEAYLRELEAREDRARGMTVDRIAPWLFEQGSPWVERQKRRRDGRPLSESTLQEYRRHVRDYILPRWAHVAFRSIRPLEVEDWLYSIDVSNRYRRSIWGTLKIILDEAVRRNVISRVPTVELPQKKSRGSRRALTPAELHTLFPSREGQLASLWTEHRRGEPKNAWLMFAAMSATMFLCGLRPQEARAIHTDQLALDMATLLVTRQMTAQNEVVDYLKMGDSDSPRYRFALIPKMALWIIQEWVDRRHPVDLVFSYRNGPVRREYFRQRLIRTAQRAKIKNLEGFSPSSGRITYISVVRPLLEPAILRSLVGHMHDSTTDIYDRAELLTRARQIQGTVSVIDGALSVEGEGNPD